MTGFYRTFVLFFTSGKFTADIYVEDCLFEDPTIKFRGKSLLIYLIQFLYKLFKGKFHTMDN